MRPFRARFFLTFVLVFCRFFTVEAKPHAETDASTTNETETVEYVDPKKVDNLSITPAPDPGISELDLIKRVDRHTYFHSYKNSLTMNLGAVFGFEDSTDDDDFTNYLIGFKYLLPGRKTTRWEVGADLLTVEHGHVNVSRRRIYRPTSAFRPYYRYGLTHKFVPKERLASSSNHDNYLASVGIGFEDIRIPPKSIRLEVELLAGTEDFLGIFNIGYAWAW